MWELDYEESWVPKNWCFWTVVLEKSLESPLDCKEIQPVHPKRRSVLGVHWKDWCWGWSSNTLATSCEVLTHWKRPWCWEGLGEGGEGDDRGWDGWMTSLTWWTWIWVNTESWWCTGRPGVLQFMGSQRVRQRLSDWTELIERYIDLTANERLDYHFHCEMSFSFCHISSKLVLISLLWIHPLHFDGASELSIGSVVPLLYRKVLAATWTRTAGACLSKTTAGETWWNVHIYRWPCSIYNVKLESLVEIWLWDCSIEVSSRQLTDFLNMAWGTAVKFWG